MQYGVSLAYSSYGGGRGGGRASFGRYGRHVRTRGRINRLDRRAGVIVIKDQTYRVHPAYLEQLSRGDRVHAEYVSVAGRNWVTSIRPNARVNEGFNQGRAGHGRYHP